MKKKIIITTGLFLLFLVGLLIAVPYLFKDRIITALKTAANENLNAKLDFETIDISLFKDFPNAHLDMENLSIVNNAPFQGDTLMASKHIGLTLSLGSLFNAPDGPFDLKAVALDEALLNVKVNKEGEANYDIAKETTKESGTSTQPEGDSKYKLNLNHYEINNGRISYSDEETGMQLLITELNHQGNGDFSLEKSNLDTHSDALVSFNYAGSNFLKEQSVVLDAILEMDLAQNKYTFLDNKALINALPLAFKGYVQLIEEGQDVNIEFSTPTSDFKNFFGLIPDQYRKDIEGVTTTGSFTVQGQVKGRSTDDRIPSFFIDMKANDASFKYPDLPQKVEHIKLSAKVENATGLLEDTTVDVDQFSFQLGTDQFNALGHFKDLLDNPKIDLSLNGVVNLAKLSKAYPMPEDLNLSGLLKADIQTAFDMVSIEAEAYENTRTSGKFSLSNFQYESAELAAPLAISQMDLKFTPTTVVLNDFDGTLGKSDFSAVGTVENFLGFLFKDEDLKGNFDLSSSALYINDFLVASNEEESDTGKGDGSSTTEQLKIPSFLDAQVQAKADKVYYNDLVLEKVGGNLRIKDQKASLTGVTAGLFGGMAEMEGEVATNNPIASFDFGLKLKDIKIVETFKALDMFKILAPIGEALRGALNTEIRFSGNLKDDFTPNLATLSGGLLAELLDVKVATGNNPLLASFENQLSFVDLNKLNLDNQKAALAFSDGKVATDPIQFNFKDIPIVLEGGHSFGQEMNYKLNLQVPAKYLGNEVNDLIARIGDPAMKETTIPVSVSIGGQYSKPTLNTDLTTGVKQLTSSLIEYQKQQLLDKGKDKAGELLGGFLNKNNMDTTTTSEKKVGDAVKDLLNNKKTSDTTATQSKTEDKVKNILGGLLGNRKKKDSINK